MIDVRIETEEARSIKSFVEQWVANEGSVEKFATKPAELTEEQKTSLMAAKTVGDLNDWSFKNNLVLWPVNVQDIPDENLPTLVSVTFVSYQRPYAPETAGALVAKYKIEKDDVREQEFLDAIIKWTAMYLANPEIYEPLDLTDPVFKTLSDGHTFGELLSWTKENGFIMVPLAPTGTQETTEVSFKFYRKVSKPE